MRKYVIATSMALMLGMTVILMESFPALETVSVFVPEAEATIIKTRGKCASAKKQYKSYNRALRRQIKDLQKAHSRIFKVSPNRVVGYTQEVVNKSNGVHQAATELKNQAAIIQEHCVENKQMDEPLI